MARIQIKPFGMIMTWYHTRVKIKYDYESKFMFKVIKTKIYFQGLKVTLSIP